MKPFLSIPEKGHKKAKKGNGWKDAKNGFVERVYGAEMLF